MLPKQAGAKEGLAVDLNDGRLARLGTASMAFEDHRPATDDFAGLAEVWRMRWRVLWKILRAVAGGGGHGVAGWQATVVVVV